MIAGAVVAVIELQQLKFIACAVDRATTKTKPGEQWRQPNWANVKMAMPLEGVILQRKHTERKNDRPLKSHTEDNTWKDEQFLRHHRTNNTFFSSLYSLLNGIVLDSVDAFIELPIRTHVGSPRLSLIRCMRTSHIEHWFTPCASTVFRPVIAFKTIFKLQLTHWRFLQIFDEIMTSSQFHRNPFADSIRFFDDTTDPSASCLSIVFFDSPLTAPHNTFSVANFSFHQPITPALECSNWMKKETASIPRKFLLKWVF